MKKLLFVWLICFVLQAEKIEFHFSKYRKNNELFWKFDIHGKFPQKSGFIHTKILFAGGEVPHSRHRLLVSNHQATFVFGPVSNKILSGTYELQILYTHKKIRRNYSFQYFLGNPFSQKQQQLAYIQFFEKFLHSNHELQKWNLQDKNNLKDYKKLLAENEHDLQKIVPPQVLAPYFPQIVFSAQKVVQLQKVILRKAKKLNLQSSYHKNVNYYLQQIAQVVVPSRQLNADSVRNDLKWCDHIIHTIDNFSNNSHSAKNIETMSKYFALEISHLKKREEQYKKSSFSNKLHSKLKSIRLSIENVVYHRLIHLVKKYQIRLQIKRDQFLSLEQAMTQYTKSKSYIEKYLYQKEQQHKLTQKNLHLRYLQLFAEYQNVKKQAMEDQQLLSMLKKKLQEMPKELPQLRSKFAKMLFYLQKIYTLRKKSDPLSKAYVSKYKLYLKDIEKYFSQKSQ